METLTIISIIVIGYTYFDLVDWKREFFKRHKWLDFLYLGVTLTLMVIGAATLE